MQTSLGSFFEKLATIFAGKNDFEIISNDQLQRPNLNEETRFLLDETRQNRESGNGEIKLNDFKEKFNKLLNEKNYKCPICGEYLKQSSL